ncbi:MAG: hypothetical protein GWN97_05970, partial [Thermoplasmata archaeon]|nr:hypothetical protein [Thermoplasmata archaeon]NIT76515.1 hypothetical protein [Thermoplasmata archaeon]NIY02886.1 hypothetical protein [Thermoplasmata archaeon]
FFHVEEGAFTSIGFTQFRIAIEMKVDFFQTIWAFAKEEVRAQKPELEKLRKAGEIGDLVEQIG